MGEHRERWEAILAAKKKARKLIIKKVVYEIKSKRVYDSEVLRNGLGVGKSHGT